MIQDGTAYPGVGIEGIDHRKMKTRALLPRGVFNLVNHQMRVDIYLVTMKRLSFAHQRHVKYPKNGPKPGVTQVWAAQKCTGPHEQGK